MTGSDPLDISFADNERFTMAQRLRAEIADGNDECLDIATGYLAVSVWGAAGAAIEKVRQVRLLLGKDWEMKARTASDDEADITSLVKQALRDETQPPRLPTATDAAEIRAFIEWLERRDVQVKAWRGEGFLHAKAYILDKSAGVGSANFTGAGFQWNRELVMWRQDRPVVRELREWFEDFWNSTAACDYKPELIEELRNTRFGGGDYRPYDVLIRVLADRYGLDEPPSLDQATFRLKWFQEEAVFRLIKLLSSPARGALLADAVGLGKTFMALGVIHHFLHQKRESVRGRPVLLIIPASLRETWEKVLDDNNLRWAVDIVHVQHLKEDFDISKFIGADLVVVDEAHRLRGGRMWFQKTMEILSQSVRAGGDPRVLLLTATPVNTGVRDLTRLLQVITKNRRNVWAPEIPDFERYLTRFEKGEIDPYPLLDRSMVRRSRSDLLRAYEERRLADPHIEAITLPTRRLGHEEYKYDTAVGGPDPMSVFEDVLGGLHLAPYDLDRFLRPEPGQLIEIDDEDIPASPLAGLYVAGLLKRFESSVRAIDVSLRRLDRVLELFHRGLKTDPPRVLRLADVPELQRLVDAEARGDEEGDVDEDRIDELMEKATVLGNPGDYDLDAVAAAVQADRDAIDRLRAALPDESDDGKFDALLELVTRPMSGQRVGLRDRRVLLFTQFRDTAEYVARRLNEAAKRNRHVGHVELLHGGSTTDKRTDIARTFDPDEIGDLLAANSGRELPRILVSTDVLAEGHNLQLAEAVINYDLHWNPQVAVQRAGRVDRLNSPHSTIYLLSFLPFEGLDALLNLIDRLNGRFRLYKQLGLQDEPITRLPADQVVAKSLEQLRRLYRDDDDVLDDIERTWTLGSTDYMRAPLDAYLREHAVEALKNIPQGVQSAKYVPDGWPHGPGAFIAFQYRNDQDDSEAFWRFYPRLPGLSWGPPLRDDQQMFHAISCSPGTRRAAVPGDMDPGGPGGLIDWDLLRRAATDLAHELTAARNTAKTTRGASERSARFRARLLAVAGEEPPASVDDLLDRLEQVRVEDYDTDRRYEQLMERLRSAEKEDDAERRKRLVADLAQRGIDLFGEYEEDDEDTFTVTVDPDNLRLTAWETLVEQPGASPKPVTVQLSIAEQSGSLDLGDTL